MPDTTKPYFTKTYSVLINNNVLPTVPEVSINNSTQSPRVVNTIQLDLATGPELLNCETFSKLAFTETNSVPGIMQFNTNCATVDVQTETITFDNTEGTKNIYIWAIDSSGMISEPRSINFILDTTSPILSIQLNQSKVKGSVDYNINYSASDAAFGIHQIQLYYTQDGTNYTLVNDLSKSSNVYSWTAPIDNTVSAQFKIVADDEAGHSTTSYSSIFEVDSTAPNVAITNPSSNASVVLANTLSSYSISGTCSESGRSVQISGDTTGSVNCNAGNSTASVTKTIIKDSIVPVVTLTSNLSDPVQGASQLPITWSASDLNLKSNPISIYYSLDGGANWNLIVNSTSNLGSYIWTVPNVTSLQSQIKIVAEDLADLTGQVISSNFVIDSNRPTLTPGQMTINSGSASSNINSVQMALAGSDAESNLTHFCFKYTTGLTVPTEPLANDSCWLALNAPSPGLSLSKNISFQNFFYQIGFTTGSYTIYSWLKDQAGNISTLSNSGAGTISLDKNTIYYDSGFPPTIVNVISVNTDTPSNPILDSELVVTSGSDVFIKWKLTDDTALPALPVNLYYTTDETNFTLIAANIANSANSGCLVDGVNYTGCYKWTSGAPVSTYFKIRVAAIDASGMSSFSSASPNNMSLFKIIAGNTDPGLGGSAASALIFSSMVGALSDTRTLVVTPDGKFYIRDLKRGILTIDPIDGKLKSFIPYTGAKVDGAIGTATLANAYARMILDYQGNLLIYDTNSIRKVNLLTQTVTTIIGGGSATTSGSVATDLSIDCVGSGDVLCPMIALPNGNIYFMRLPNSTAGIWKYNVADGKVYSIIPSGNGVYGNAGFDISAASSTLTHFSLDYDVTNSTINKFYANFRQNSCTGCGYSMYSAELNQSTWASTGTGAPFPNGDSYSGSINSMNGKIYAIPSNVARALWKLDTVTNTWIKMLGSTLTGSCDDGTLATSCNVYLQDAFVTAQGNIYFLDNGLVRTIDDTGKVKTLFGQRKTFGDGGLAQSARFNKIVSIDQASNGNIGVLDSVENVLREISPSGIIDKIIGNGTQGAITNGAAGVTQSIPGGYWGNEYQFLYDKSNDDIYYTGPNQNIIKYDRASGTVSKVIGGGATGFGSADGMLGASVALNGYPLQLVGFDGSKILGITDQWNGTAHYNNYWKFYDKTDSYRQSQFGGNANIAIGNYSPDGTNVSTADLPMAFSNAVLRGFWDSTNSTWYFGRHGQSYIKTLPVSGVIGTLVTLPRGIISWTLTTNVSLQKIIYYCNGTKIYKYNIATITETALPWPSSTMTCTGNSMFRSSIRNSIVFPFQQNGLYGVAEIIDTP